MLEYGAPIHMRDLIPLQGVYKKLGWDTAKRDAVLTEFIQVIKTTRLIGFGVGVDARAFSPFILLLRKMADRRDSGTSQTPKIPSKTLKTRQNAPK
jgi:hypothetical protein